VVNQVAFEVIGNDLTITMASEAGQLQLNAFEPIMGWSLYKSISHLTTACRTLTQNCVVGLEANRELLAKRVSESITVVTALNPLIGYERAALLAKTAIATGQSFRETARQLQILEEHQIDELLTVDKLTRPASPQA
jgi:aspartate ammonia-lyase